MWISCPKEDSREQVISFNLVSDLWLLGEMAPLVSWLLPHGQIKSNRVKKVVIWKSLVAIGCRGWGLEDLELKCLGEAKAGEPAPSRTNFTAGTKATATGGSEESFVTPLSQRSFQELYFSCQLVKKQKRNNRFKLK